LFGTAIAIVLSAAPASLSAARLTDAEVATDCKPLADADYLGSIHAGSCWSQPLFVTPTAKDRQPFTCGGRRAVVLWMELASEKEVDEFAPAFGARLWGAGQPSEEHADELLRGGRLIAIVSGPGAAPLVARLEKKGLARYRASRTPAPEDAPIDKRISAEVDCGFHSTDVLNYLCIATRRGDGPIPMPAAPELYVGATVAIPKGAAVRDSAMKNFGISALSIGGGRAMVRAITPDDEDERRQLMDVAAQALVVLRGKSKSIVVPAGLASFLESMRASLPREGQPVKAGSFTAGRPARIYSVNDPVAGRVLVVVENAADGTWLNLFPTIPPKAK
jgi:hypothetical protein